VDCWMAMAATSESACWQARALGLCSSGQRLGTRQRRWVPTCRWQYPASPALQAPVHCAMPYHSQCRYCSRGFYRGFCRDLDRVIALAFPSPWCQSKQRCRCHRCYQHDSGHHGSGLDLQEHERRPARAGYCFAQCSCVSPPHSGLFVAAAYPSMCLTVAAHYRHFGPHPSSAGYLCHESRALAAHVASHHFLCRRLRCRYLCCPCHLR
jgi:hypothetical protein